MELLIGFSGIVFLFSDNFLINENNFVAAALLISAWIYLLCNVGGVITLKISNKENENVTGSILIWSTIILLTIYFNLIEKPLDAKPYAKNRLNYICNIFRNFSYWYSMVVDDSEF